MKFQRAQMRKPSIILEMTGSPYFERGPDCRSAQGQVQSSQADARAYQIWFRPWQINPSWQTDTRISAGIPFLFKKSVVALGSPLYWAVAADCRSSTQPSGTTSERAVPKQRWIWKLVCGLKAIYNNVFIEHFRELR